MTSRVNSASQSPRSKSVRSLSTTATAERGLLRRERNERRLGKRGRVARAPRRSPAPARRRSRHRRPVAETRDLNMGCHCSSSCKRPDQPLNLQAVRADLHVRFHVEPRHDVGLAACRLLGAASRAPRRSREQPPGPCRRCETQSARRPGISWAASSREARQRIKRLVDVGGGVVGARSGSGSPPRPWARPGS